MDPDDDPVLSLRRCCQKQYPNWCTNAAAALRVSIGGAASYARAKGVRGGALVHLARVGAPPPPAPAAFVPPYVHQLFPGDTLFGYRGSAAAPVALRVWVREPELSVCVTGVAPGGALEGEVPVRLPLEREGADGGGAGGGGGKSMRLRAGKDDILEMLGAVLPRDFPAASFATAVGAEACSPLAPPLPLHFFPPPPPQGAGAAAWAPPGELVRAYARGPAAFAVHRWAPSASPELQAYHARLAALALWLIENASAIDASDHRWEVLSVYQTGGLPQAGEGEGEEEEEEEAAAAPAAGGGAGAAAGAPPAPQPPPRPLPTPALVGYCTVYRFTNPMRDQRPHCLRVAQMLCLPRYQRAGHGGEMLAAVQALADGDGGGEGVLEVSVEDPCEGMARLRDAHDVARAAAQRLFAAHPAFAPGAEAPLEAIAELGEAEVAAVVRALRVTPAQARRCYLALLLGRLGLLAGGGAAGGVSTSEAPRARAYRLLVKRVLYNGDAELRAVGDASVRKAALERGFVEAVASFAGALARCSPAQATRLEAADAQRRWAAAQRELELEEEASEHARAVERRLESAY